MIRIDSPRVLHKRAEAASLATIDEKHAFRTLREWMAVQGLSVEPQRQVVPAAPGLLVGTWSLVSCYAFRRNGHMMPIYGPRPEGRLFYDASGNMSVHIMQSGRPRFQDPEKFRATEPEMRLAYRTYEAYFSTYEVDAEHSLIRHHVHGGLFPNWTGTVQSRYYRFDGPDRLILSTEPIGALPTRKAIVILEWARLA